MSKKHDYPSPEMAKTAYDLAANDNSINQPISNTSKEEAMKTNNNSNTRTMNEMLESEIGETTNSHQWAAQQSTKPEYETAAYSELEAQQCVARGFRHEDGSFVKRGFPFGTYTALLSGEKGPHWAENVKTNDIVKDFFTNGNSLFVVTDPAKKWDDGRYQFRVIEAEARPSFFRDAYECALQMVGENPYVHVERGLHLRVKPEDVSKIDYSVNVGEISWRYEGKNETFRKLAAKMSEGTICRIVVEGGVVRYGKHIKPTELQDTEWIDGDTGEEKKRMMSKEEIAENKAFNRFAFLDMVASGTNIQLKSNPKAFRVGMYKFHAKLALMLHYATPDEIAGNYTAKKIENENRYDVAVQHFIRENKPETFKKMVEHTIEKTGNVDMALPLFGNTSVMVKLADVAQVRVFRGNIPQGIFNAGVDGAPVLFNKYAKMTDISVQVLSK